MTRDAGHTLNDPDTGATIMRAKRLMENGKFPTVATILADNVQGLGFFEKYDVNQMMIMALFERFPKQMRRFVIESRRLGGGTGFESRLGELLLQTLETDTDQLDQVIRDYLGKLDPVWVEVSRSLETEGNEWIQIGFPNTNASTWNQSVQQKPFVVATKATILNGTEKQLNLRFGVPTEFVQVSFTAGYGFNLFRYANDQWTNLAAVPIAGIEVSKLASYRIAVDPVDGAIAVSVNSKLIHEGDVHFSEKCRVGLSVQNGAVAKWQDFQIE